MMPSVRFGEYELHDLAVLDHSTTGMIIAIDKDTCRVLTNQAHFETAAASPDNVFCML